jgi:hypothetical protein
MTCSTGCYLPPATCRPDSGPPGSRGTDRPRIDDLPRRTGVHRRATRAAHRPARPINARLPDRRPRRTRGHHPGELDQLTQAAAEAPRWGGWGSNPRPADYESAQSRALPCPAVPANPLWPGQAGCRRDQKGRAVHPRAADGCSRSVLLGTVSSMTASPTTARCPPSASTSRMPPPGWPSAEARRHRESHRRDLWPCPARLFGPAATGAHCANWCDIGETTTISTRLRGRFAPRGYAPIDARWPSAGSLPCIVVTMIMFSSRLDRDR